MCILEYFKNFDYNLLIFGLFFFGIYLIENYKLFFNWIDNFWGFFGLEWLCVILINVYKKKLIIFLKCIYNLYKKLLWMFIVMEELLVLIKDDLIFGKCIIVKKIGRIIGMIFG